MFYALRKNFFEDLNNKLKSVEKYFKYKKQIQWNPSIRTPPFFDNPAFWTLFKCEAQVLHRFT